MSILAGTGQAADQQAALQECRNRESILRLGLKQHRAHSDDLRSRLSLEVCEQLRPAHIAAVRRIVDALRALDAETRAEIDIRDAVKASGFDAGSLPALSMSQGRPKAPPSPPYKGAVFGEITNGRFIPSAGAVIE